MEEKKKPNLFKLFAVVIVVLVIAAGVVMGLGALGMPFWPFFLLLTYFGIVEGMSPAALTRTAVGGGLALVIAYVPVLIGALTGIAVLAQVLNIVLLIAYLMVIFDARLTVLTSGFGLILITCLSTGLHQATYAELLPVVGSYALCTLALWGTCAVLKAQAKKKTQAEGAAA